MENNNKNLDLSNKNDKQLNHKSQPKPTFKPTPKPESTITQKIKELYITTKENTLKIINTVLDYTLDIFSEFQNVATNDINPPNNSNQNKVQLNEEAVTNELIAKAKYDGDTKEAVLSNKNNNSPNMVGSSLVVDMDVQKIEATIAAMDQRLNPTVNNVNEPIEAKPKVEPELNESIAQPKTTSVKENKAEKKLVPEPPKPKPRPKLKPEFPKPMPKNKAELKPEVPKPIMQTMNVQANMEAFRNKFVKNQEENPYVLE